MSTHRKRRLSILPRWWHKRYAKKHGYFWLPCPVCGRWTGGHEWKAVGSHETSIPDPNFPREPGRLGHGIGICKSCALNGVGDRAWRN